MLPGYTQDSSSGTLLKGSVQHSETLPPLKLEEISKHFSLKRETDLAAPPEKESKNKPAAPAESFPKPARSVDKAIKQATQPPRAPLKKPLPSSSGQSVPGIKPHISTLKEFNSKFAKVAVGGGYYAVVPAGQSGQVHKLQANAEAPHSSGTAGAAGRLSALAPVASAEQAKLKGNVQSVSETVIRFAVPMWLAGVWQRKQMTETARTQLPSGKQLRPLGASIARVTDNFGTVKDKEGHILQLFDPAHSTGQVDRGATVDVEHVFDYKLQILDDKRVLVIARAWHAQLSKLSHKVVSAYQDEEFNTYTSLPGICARTVP